MKVTYEINNQDIERILQKYFESRGYESVSTRQVGEKFHVEFEYGVDEFEQYN